MNELPANGAVFDSNWLCLREPVDHRSRPSSLASAAGRWLSRRAARRAEAPRIVDIGTGRGSNARYLTPFMPSGSCWTLLDQDAALLDEAGRSLDAWRHRGNVVIHPFDLAEPAGPAITGCDLITASALLDLVSSRWIEHWVSACRQTEAAVLCAVSVNGQICFHGRSDGEDHDVLRGLALDQARDKGLGTALGTQAPRMLIDTLAAHGYAITAMPSNWRLTAADAALSALLLTGWAQAAAGNTPGRFDAWARRRQASLAAGELVLSIGHIDVLGLPTDASRPPKHRTAAELTQPVNGTIRFDILPNVQNRLAETVNKAQISAANGRKRK